MFSCLQFPAEKFSVSIKHALNLKRHLLASFQNAKECQGGARLIMLKVLKPEVPCPLLFSQLEELQPSARLSRAGQFQSLVQHFLPHPETVREPYLEPQNGPSSWGKGTFFSFVNFNEVFFGN